MFTLQIPVQNGPKPVINPAGLKMPTSMGEKYKIHIFEVLLNFGASQAANCLINRKITAYLGQHWIPLNKTAVFDSLFLL